MAAALTTLSSNHSAQRLFALPQRTLPIYARQLSTKNELGHYETILEQASVLGQEQST
jgi:hypothetical protein